MPPMVDYLLTYLDNCGVYGTMTRLFEYNTRQAFKDAQSYCGQMGYTLIDLEKA
jgi:hypothetical protein